MMSCINSFSATSLNLFCGAQRGNGRNLLKRPHASTFSSGLRLGMDENPQGIISGEWPENFSLLSFDDLRVYLLSQEPVVSIHEPRGPVLIGEVMSRPVRVAKVDQTLEEVAYHFDTVSLLPVTDENLRCVGVVSEKDITNASHGVSTEICEIMTSPAITLTEDKTIMEAASLMLKKKVHKIPIVNKERNVIGIITRADVLRELEALLKI